MYLLGLMVSRLQYEEKSLFRAVSLTETEGGKPEEWMGWTTASVRLADVTDFLHFLSQAPWANKKAKFKNVAFRPGAQDEQKRDSSGTVAVIDIRNGMKGLPKADPLAQYINSK